MTHCNFSDLSAYFCSRGSTNHSSSTLFLRLFRRLRRKHVNGNLHFAYGSNGMILQLPVRVAYPAYLHLSQPVLKRVEIINNKVGLRWQPANGEMSSRLLLCVSPLTASVLPVRCLPNSLLAPGLRWQAGDCDEIGAKIWKPGGRNVLLHRNVRHKNHSKYYGSEERFFLKG